MPKRINRVLKSKIFVFLLFGIIFITGILTFFVRFPLHQDACTFLPPVLSVRERMTTYSPSQPDDRISSYLQIINKRVDLAQTCTSKNSAVAEKELSKAVNGVGLIAENIRSMDQTNSVRFEDISKGINHIRVTLLSPEFTRDPQWANGLDAILTDYEVSVRTIYFNGLSSSETVGLPIPSIPSK